VWFWFLFGRVGCEGVGLVCYDLFCVGGGLLVVEGGVLWWGGGFWVCLGLVFFDLGGEGLGGGFFVVIGYIIVGGGFCFGCGLWFFVLFLGGGGLVGLGGGFGCFGVLFCFWCCEFVCVGCLGGFCWLV